MKGYLNNIESLVRLCKYEKKYGTHKLKKLFTPVISQVLRHGYAVIPEYWSRDKCERARNKIDAFIEAGDTNLWQDPLKSDSRIMGSNNLDPDLDIYSDKYITSIISSLYNVQELHGFSMAAKLRYVEGNLGSGQGWHRDSAVVHQFKAILYLSDVAPTQGPFQYFKGSGNLFDMYCLEAKTGISIDENRLEGKLATFEKNGMEYDELCAPAGTLVIANTRGIHRGKPIEQGDRYALTNYYWKEGIPCNFKPLMN